MKKSDETPPSSMVVMEAPLTATYFPFTHVPPFLQEAASLFVDCLVVYRPVGLATATLHPNWSDRFEEPFVDLRTFHAEPTMEGRIVSEFETWKAWGQMQQREGVGYFKHMQGELGPAGPFVPGIVSEIKGKKDQPLARDDVDFASQFFLHLAHDFDQQSIELDMQLCRVKEKRDTMLRFLRHDGLGDEERPLPVDTFNVVPQDRGQIMTANRIAAWGHLFSQEKSGHHVLITDSPMVYALLLDQTKDARDLSGFRWRCKEGSKSGNATEGDLLREQIRSLFLMLLHHPINAEAEKQTAEIFDRVERLAGNLESAQQEGHEMGAGYFSCRWHLIPGMDSKKLFGKNSHSSQREKSGANTSTLLGLIEHHERIGQ